MESRQESIARYLQYCESIITEFQKTQDIIEDNEVTPMRVYTAMANHFVVSSALISEYQRVKREHRTLELQYQVWWDKKLEAAQDDVIASYKEELVLAEKTKTKGSLTKPSVSEYAQRARIDNEEEYLQRTTQLDEADAQVRFILRMITTLEKQYNLLQSISNSMKTEMKSLNLDADMSTISTDVLTRRTRRI